MRRDRTARPVSPDERTQGTFDCLRTVLLVGRTQTSTGRLLEALRFFRDDFRVKTAFTVNDTSQYSSGVRSQLAAAGVDEIVPWDRVGELSYALALSASENVDFSALRGPVVVLPHGVGFNKWVPDPDNGGTRLAGLPDAKALRSGEVRLVLGHPAQERQLLAVRPEVAGSTEVIGDPTFDQLRASLPLRERYRRELGLDGRKLVLLSSTWRRESELGSWRTLPLELLAELPSDEYQVALAIHPNVWAWYGTAVVRNWFSAALDAGLLLLPPQQGWHAALVAAHLVIGDHGSVTLYGAGLGKPLLLAALGEEHVAGTPIERLGRTADRLDPHRDLLPQVERALSAQDPNRFAELTSEVFAHVGEAETRLRDFLYSQLDLEPPEGEAALLRPPDPQVTARPVTAHDTFAEFTAADELRIRRFPRAARDRTDRPESRAELRHLAVEEDEPDLRRSHQAAVYVRRAPSRDPAAWTAHALESLPGARVAAVAHARGCVAELRDGRRLEITAEDQDPVLLASIAYACFRSPAPLPRDLTIHIGRATFTARVGHV